MTPSPLILNKARPHFEAPAARFGGSQVAAGNFVPITHGNGASYSNHPAAMQQVMSKGDVEGV